MGEGLVIPGAFYVPRSRCVKTDDQSLITNFDHSFNAGLGVDVVLDGAAGQDGASALG